MDSKRTDKCRAKIARAMKGNKNAEKWTEKLVVDTLDAMIEYCIEEYEVEVEEKSENGVTAKGQGFEKNTKKKMTRSVHLKSHLLMHFRLWDKKWFASMREKFGKDRSERFPNSLHSPTVLNRLDAIDLILETNSYNDASDGKTVANVTIMNLMTHYGYRTKEEKEVNKTIGGKIKVNLPEVDERVKEAYERALKQMEKDIEP